VSIRKGLVSDVIRKFEVSIIEFNTKALPVSRWHHVQWQQCVQRKEARTSYVMVLHVQWPFKGVNASVAIAKVE
jgi:hypothetical protein